MNTDYLSDPTDPGRFRLLATFLAGRSLGVAAADPGQPPYTDGAFVFVSPDAAPDLQRREVVLQAALLGAGSLDPRFVGPLRRNQRAAHRYLALEGRRVLAGLRGTVPAADAAEPTGIPATGSPAESLDLAFSRKKVADPPEWFGTIRPWRLAKTAKAEATVGSDQADPNRQLKLKVTDIAEATDEDEENSEESKIFNSLQNPLFSSPLTSKMAQKVLGMSRSLSNKLGGGADTPVGSARRVDSVGPHARPIPVPLELIAPDRGGRAAGYGGALYPEWDVHQNRYRPQWCRVLDFPVWASNGLLGDSETRDGHVERDEVLRRRLARLGLGPKVLRGRPDGQDLDVDALIDFAVGVQAGHSSQENIYLDRRQIARDLGVLILLDISGSATESDIDSTTVHEIQRRAAATLTVTLEDLGDRVAVYAFRSQSRSGVYMMAIKPFSQRFGARGRAQLNSLEPGGYTRLGAAIRHSGEILKSDAGTPHRLLLVLSDGFPYDDGYESRYGEADTFKALEELRSDGVACLCLSIGSSTSNKALERVFGSASHASAPRLAQLSPRMDELVLGALKELSVGQARR